MSQIILSPAELSELQKTEAACIEKCKAASIALTTARQDLEDVQKSLAFQRHLRIQRGPWNY